MLSISRPTHIDIYLEFSDPISQKRLASTCKYFQAISIAAKYATYIYNFAKDNFYFIENSSSVDKLSIATIFRWNAVLLGECHSVSAQMRINSLLINMLYIKDITDIYTETGDDSQIPYANELIRDKIKRWDTEQERLLDRNMDFLIHASCDVCKAYLKNSTGESFDFSMFLKSYLDIVKVTASLTKNIKDIDHLLCTPQIEEICKKAECETDLVLLHKSEFSQEGS